MPTLEWYIERVKSLEEEREVFGQLLAALDEGSKAKGASAHVDENETKILREEVARLRKVERPLSFLL